MRTQPKQTDRAKRNTHTDRRKNQPKQPHKERNNQPNGLDHGREKADGKAKDKTALSFYGADLGEMGRTKEPTTPPFFKGGV